MNVSWSQVEQWLDVAHDWLIQIEPEPLRQAPLPVRLAVLWAIMAVASGTLKAMPSALGEVAAIGTHRLARRVATHSAPVFIDLLAALTVRLERLIRRYGLDLQFGERYVTPDDVADNEPSSVGNLPAGPPRASHPVAKIGAGAFLALLMLAEILAATLRWMARLAFRPSFTNLVAWTAVLWYVGWFAPLAAWADRLTVPAVPLTQVIAVLTIAVLAYATLGSDLRGRSEINKTASVEIRKVLLAAQQPLSRVADALEETRTIVAAYARQFPDPAWLAQAFGDGDCRWRLNTIDHPDRWFRRMPSVAMFVRDVLEPESSAADAKHAHSAAILRTQRQVRTDRLATLAKELTEAESRVHELVQTITEQGFSHKLSAVLPGPVNHAWVHLTGRRFHRGLAQTLPLAGDPEWYAQYFPSEMELRRVWANATTPERRNLAAAHIAREIRRANGAAHADLWQLAVTEQRVRMLVEGIGAMLHPRPLA
jgi:hypothetical protein